MSVGIPVYVVEHAAACFDDGRPRLFTFVRDRRIGGPMILVHPSRIEAFTMAINQQDVFAHPEVQELLGLSASLPTSNQRPDRT